MTKKCQKTATYDGEELTITFSQTFVLDDYGVERSPTFWSPCNDVEIVSLVIGGKDVDASKLPLDAKDALIAFADDLEWEAHE